MRAIDPVLGHLLHVDLPILPGNRTAVLVAPHFVLRQDLLTLIRALLILLLHTFGRTIVHPGLAFHAMPGTRENRENSKAFYLKLSH